MKRIGLIGDVHSEDNILEAALSFLSKQNVDAILCVGDLADGKGSLDRCVTLLEHHRVVTVRGNHDRWILENSMRGLEDTQLVSELPAHTREYLAQLPPTRRLETAAGPLHLCHGLGNDDMHFVNDARGLEFELRSTGYSYSESLQRHGIDPDTQLLVNGHTHARWAARVGQWGVINAGTLRRNDRPCFALLDVSAATYRVEYFEVSAELQVTPAESIVL